MDAVLHIEPITRRVPSSMRVGHTDYVWYGETISEDGDNLGSGAGHLRVGSPLDFIDIGSNEPNIPLVKTIECAPDFTRNTGHIFSETIHYFKDRQNLIPIRSKIRSGLGQGLRLSHLPSLSYSRSNISGVTNNVIDPGADIVSDLLFRDSYFQSSQNRPLKDWISEDLAPALSKLSFNKLSFNSIDLTSMTNRYRDQIHRTPTEITSRHLKDITSILTPHSSLVPLRYMSHDAIIHPLVEFRNNLAYHDVDLRSFGCIRTEKLARIEYNPYAFQDVCDLLDIIPLTDFNLDYIVRTDGEIVFHYDHLALDRIGAFAGNDVGLYSPATILEEFITGPVLNEIVQKFAAHHSDITAEIEDVLYSEPVKVKLIKTITDEAAVLLYRYNSTSEDAPLCGVYFDIALQSLAPMSIVPEPVIN